MKNIELLYQLCFPDKNASLELKNLSDYSYKIIDNICFVTYKIISADEAEIYDIGTHPDHQNKGHASNLINNLIVELKLVGIKNIFLEVAENNLSGIKLYENCGFEKYSVRKDYYNYTGKKINAVLMKKVICL